MSLWVDHGERVSDVVTDIMTITYTIHTGRMYPGFWSQSGIRMSGFSDVPLTVPKEADVFNDIFEAKYITQYLESYVDTRKYADKTLRERITLEFTVSSVDKTGGTWVVKGKGQPDLTEASFRTKRVIVATGTTSDAKMPVFPGSDSFCGRIIHQRDYGRFATKNQPTPQKVAILGAGKSAADVVYNQAKAGHEVHWIIRKSGQGPGIFTNPADNAKGPFLNDPELAATRLFGTLSPGCFTQPNMWTRLLHGSAMGSKIIDGFFGTAEEKCKKVGDFQHRDGALPGFEQLESDVK
jgi:dimethylaniline monooxygenase (N-oxide forming)